MSRVLHCEKSIEKKGNQIVLRLSSCSHTLYTRNGNKKWAQRADVEASHRRPDHLAISYNGGKDCLVLLILILACLPAWETSAAAASANPSSDPSTNSSPAASIPSSLQALYIISTNPFPEVQGFVANTAHEYRLDLASFSDGMRGALSDYLAERPKVRAVFVGTRRTDPHSADLPHFAPTDEGWPACMRVHPIIDWHYAEIWAVSFFSLFFYIQLFFTHKRERRRTRKRWLEYAVQHC